MLTDMKMKSSNYFKAKNLRKQVLGIIICQFILNLALSVQAVPGSSTPLKRFEYKYSFKPPYLAQKDGTVPFFEYSGSKLLENYLFRISIVVAISPKMIT